MIENDSRRFKT